VSTGKRTPRPSTRAEVSPYAVIQWAKITTHAKAITPIRHLRHLPQRTSLGVLPVLSAPPTTAHASTFLVLCVFVNPTNSIRVDRGVAG
jgi:hypothetical protein